MTGLPASVLVVKAEFLQRSGMAKASVPSSSPYASMAEMVQK